MEGGRTSKERRNLSAETGGVGGGGIPWMEEKVQSKKGGAGGSAYKNRNEISRITPAPKARKSPPLPRKYGH